MTIFLEIANLDSENTRHPSVTPNICRWGYHWKEKVILCISIYGLKLNKIWVLTNYRHKIVKSAVTSEYLEPENQFMAVPVDDEILSNDIYNSLGPDLWNAMELYCWRFVPMTSNLDFIEKIKKREINKIKYPKFSVLTCKSNNSRVSSVVVE